MRFVFQSNLNLRFFSLKSKSSVHMLTLPKTIELCPVFFERINVRREKFFVEILTCLFVGFVNSF